MLTKLHQELGIPHDYGREIDLPRFVEAAELVEVGPNLVGRMQSLTPETALRWQEMVAAAGVDGVALMIVSGYRSIEYQAALIRKKINAGQGVDEILTVNAAPGYSEHHSGRAVDIASPGSRPLTEEFESSDAFVWLTARAMEFDFRSATRGIIVTDSSMNHGIGRLTAETEVFRASSARPGQSCQLKNQ